jgi:hypothetical protein
MLIKIGCATELVESKTLLLFCTLISVALDPSWPLSSCPLFDVGAVLSVVC